MIEIVLRGAPRGKERPRLTKGGHVYTPQKTRDYEAALKAAATLTMGDAPPLEGPIALEIDVRLPIPKSWPKKRREAAASNRLAPTSKPDFDNYAKTVDALNQLVWIDDGQVIDARIRKRYSDTPGMWIRVYSVGELFS